jgi:hypothetical protein
VRWVLAAVLGVSALVFVVLILTLGSDSGRQDRSILQVLGKTQDKAEAILGDAGFQVASKPVCGRAGRGGVARSVCANAPRGMVIAQSGTAIEGATVTLKVSARRSE